MLLVRDAVISTVNQANTLVLVRVHLNMVVLFLSNTKLRSADCSLNGYLQVALLSQKGHAILRVVSSWLQRYKTSSKVFYC